MRRRLGYTISYHQAFYQHGVALYNIVIDVDNISRSLNVKFDGDLKGFLTNAYSVIVKNAVPGLVIYEVFAILNVMRDFGWLSSWQYKQFILSAYASLCEFRSSSYGIKCDMRRAKKVLHLALDLNAATDFDAVVTNLRYNIRITAVGTMLLNLRALYRVGSLSNVEGLARKIVEFPMKLLSFVNEKVNKVGEIPLAVLVKDAVDELSEYQEILHYNAIPIIANDVMQLLLLYQSDRVDQAALLRQLVRWVERA